jgi:hypothetical protein
MRSQCTIATGRTMAGFCVAIMAIALAACGSVGPAEAGTNPCEEVVEGVGGKIVPKTSGLSCTDIKALIELRPPEPGRFSAMAPEGGDWWKCNIGPPKVDQLIICRQGRRYFAVVRSG